MSLSDIFDIFNPSCKLVSISNSLSENSSNIELINEKFTLNFYLTLHF